MKNALVDEYVGLWNTVLAERDEYLPQIIEAGLATTREKIGVDTIDLVIVKQEQVSELMTRLKAADEEYRELLAEFKAHTTINDEPGKVVYKHDERGSRIADFMFGLIMSLNRDFSNAPDLEHMVQQIYLFALKNNPSD